MARQKGSFSLGGTLEILADAPADARNVVKTKAELLDANSFPYKYIGMLVSVQSEAKVYQLIATDTTLEASWKEVGSGTVVVDSELSTTSHNAIENQAVANALNDKVDKVANKGLSTEDYTTAEKTKLDEIDLSNYVPTSDVGTANGVAELDSNGKILVSQMPNGFDNIDNGTAGGVVATASGYTATSFTKTGEVEPVTPSDDALYVDTTLNVPFRWTGSNYISVGGGGISLGETSETAYRGDRGKTAYDDSQANKTNIGTLSNLTTTAKSNLVVAVNEVNDGKVDKVTGKGLSTEDFTSAEKTKLAGLTNYDDTSLSNRVTSIENAVPSNASSSNKFATSSDIPAIDSSLDTTSTNTIENRVVAQALNGKETKLKYTVMPVASASNVGQIVQFVGATDTYQHGWFYECVAKNSSYEWSPLNVQDSSAQDERIDENIQLIGVELDTTTNPNHYIYAPYIEI